MAQGAVVITAQVRDTQQARRELESLGRASSQAGSQTARANQEIAVTAKTAAEESLRLKVAQTELQTEMARTSAEIARTAGNMVEWGTVAMVAYQHHNTLITGVSMLTRSLGPLGVAIGATIVVAKQAGDAMEYLREKATPAAAAAQSAMTSLRIVTEKTGNSFGEVRQTLDAFDDALTSRSSVAQAVRTFNSMNVSMERQQELIKAMRDGIVAMGGDVNTQLPIMALAIKRQEGELLDNMGVVSTVEQMYKNYAASIGTTADKLNQAQREEAVMRGVLEETAKFAGSAAAAMDTYQGKVNALATEQRKLAEEIGATVAPLASMVVQLERGVVALQRWSWKNFVTRPSDNELVKLPFGIPNPMQPWIDAREAEERATDAQRRLGMRQAQRAEEIWKAREGGFGPALPGGKDELDFYEARAKENARAEEEAKREAEKRRREREREAQRIANDQKRLRDQLHRDLSLIDKQGYDRERQEAMNAHQERLKLAHGNAELMRQSREIYYKTISQIDKREQADDLKRLQDWQRERRALRTDDMGESFSGTLRDIQRNREDRATSFAARLEAGGELNTREQVEGEIQRLNSISKQTSSINEQVAALKRIEELNGRLVKMDADRARSWEDIAASAITAAGSLASQAIRDGGVSGGDATRGLAGTIGGIIGTAIAPGIGTAIGSTAGSIIGDIVGASFDKHDEAARIQQEAAEEQRRAAEEQLEAASERARQDRVSNEAGRIDQSFQNELMRIDLAEKSGSLTAEEAARRRAEVQRDAGMVDIRQEVVRQLGGSGLSGLEDTLAQSIMQALQSGMTAYDVVNRGEYGGISFKGVDLSLVQLVAERLEGLELAFQNSTTERVLPGSSPQHPSYTVVLNQKDIWAFAPKDAFFRAGGPGTRRDDGGGGRGINVGGRR